MKAIRCECCGEKIDFLRPKGFIITPDNCYICYKCVEEEEENVGYLGDDEPTKSEYGYSWD